MLESVAHPPLTEVSFQCWQGVPPEPLAPLVRAMINWDLAAQGAWRKGGALVRVEDFSGFEQVYFKMSWGLVLESKNNQRVLEGKKLGMGQFGQEIGIKSDLH